MQQKNTIIWCMIIFCPCTGIIFGHFRPFFALLPHYWPQYFIFGNNVKTHLQIFSFYKSFYTSFYTSYYPFKVQQTEFFCYLEQTLPFYSPNTPQNENIKNEKKNMDISSFYTSVPKTMIIRYTVPVIRCVTDVTVIFYFGLYFSLLSP